MTFIYKVKTLISKLFIYSRIEIHISGISGPEPSTLTVYFIIYQVFNLHKTLCLQFSYITLQTKAGSTGDIS
jgi:hypothetical protein